MIRIGFSMHPNWARGDRLQEFLEPLRSAGLAALEFELDSNDPTWPEFGPLMEACRELGFGLSFHAPYRSPRTIAGFAAGARAEIEASLTPLFDLAAQHGPTTIVIHGAKSDDSPRLTRGERPRLARGEWRHELLYADTVAFLRWLLQRYPTLTLALENLNPRPRVIKVGDNRAELLQIVKEIGHARLGICWDIGHDLNAGNTELPEPAWLQQVRHVHIHDLDAEGVDHVPLIYGRCDPQRWLPPLVAAGFAGIVTLELNGRHCAALWPDRIMPALITSVQAIARALRVAEDPIGEEAK